MSHPSRAPQRPRLQTRSTSMCGVQVMWIRQAGFGGPVLGSFDVTLGGSVAFPAAIIQGEFVLFSWSSSLGDMV